MQHWHVGYQVGSYTIQETGEVYTATEISGEKGLYALLRTEIERSVEAALEDAEYAEAASLKYWEMGDSEGERAEIRRREIALESAVQLEDMARKLSPQDVKTFLRLLDRPLLVHLGLKMHVWECGLEHRCHLV